jgi:pimeloyl-ACP methyl ester carboxylesterase
MTAPQNFAPALVAPRQLSVQCLSARGLHRMAYLEWGDAAADTVLVCVHGLTRCAWDFEAVAQRLAPHMRVVAPDVVGRGASDRLADPMAYGVPQYMADMTSLLARLNARRVYWFGTSMGGLIGMALASLKDSPIERMLINDVGPRIEPAALSRIGAYVGHAPAHASFDTAVAYVRTVAASFGPHTDAQWAELTRHVVRETPQGWVMHYDPAIAKPFSAASPEQAAAGEALMWAAWVQIRARMLVVRGEQSDLLSRETVARMQADNPRAEAVEIDGVGHAPTFMQADQIDLAERFFLEE